MNNRYWIALAVLLLLLYAVRSILTPFVIALVLAYILVPLIDVVCERFKWPRALVVLGFYLILIGLIALGLYALEPALVRESRELSRNTPAIIETFVRDALGGDEVTLFGQTVRAKALADQLIASVEENFGRRGSPLQLAEQALHGVFELFLFLIVLFYLLKDWSKLTILALSLAPAQSRADIRAVAARIHQLLGRYVRGQLILVALMTTVTWIFLALIFHLRFALPIAIATGFLEIIPLVGPVIAASIAALVAFSQGGGQFALGIIIFYTIARHVEDYLVVPNVVGRAVHLHPIVTIFAVLAGGALAGVLGMVLAVPAAAALVVLWDVWRAESVSSERSAVNSQQ